jgi:SulP family sulfate permease
MYFANARFVEDRIRLELLRQPQARWVLLDMSGVNDIDAVAVRTFEELMQDCASQGVRFAFAGMKAPLRDIVSRAGWADKLGKAMIYPSLSHALPELVATAMEPPPAAQ